MVELCEKTGWQKILRMPDIFELRLRIPNYQRPYKWTKHNIEDLLSDIEDVIHAKKNAYRVGTLILHPSNDDGGILVYDIVDGQQRILTFTLLKMAMEPYFPEHIITRDGVHDSLDPFYSFSLLHDTNCQKNLSSDKLSLKNMHINYLFIKKYIDSIGDDQRVLLKTTIDEIIQFVVIAVEKQAEAFQLFDSQNTRGKRLFPHDLLKAYHLREISDIYIMRHCTERWENEESTTIRKLFNWYLYPIEKWMNREKAGMFTEREIDHFKGVRAKLGYRYANRTTKAMPCYQLGEQFEAGEHFFGMVNHYMQMLQDIQTEIKNNPNLSSVSAVINKSNDSSVGFNHAVHLFYCALMAYYDRFGVFNVRAIKKLCLWAFTIRLDMTHLGFDSINKYAVGEASKYTNTISMFSIIKKARSDKDIAYMLVDENTGKGHVDLRNNLNKLFE